MAPQLSSAQHTLYFFEGKYAIKWYKSTNENNISDANICN